MVIDVLIETSGSHDAQYYLPVVPPLVVNITTPVREAYIAGTSLVLRCTIAVDSDVNTGVAIAVKWLRNGIEMSNSARITTADPVQIGTHEYDATLRFDTLSSTRDTGNYTCRASAYPTEIIPYIANAIGESAYYFMVSGIKLQLYTEGCMLNSV